MKSPSLVCCRDICKRNEQLDTETGESVAAGSDRAEYDSLTMESTRNETGVVGSELSPGNKASEIEVTKGEVSYRHSEPGKCAQSASPFPHQDYESDSPHEDPNLRRETTSKLESEERDSSLPSEAKITLTSRGVDDLKSLASLCSEHSPKTTPDVRTKNKAVLRRRSSCHVISGRSRSASDLSPGLK